jgi:hypothetical protein
MSTYFKSLQNRIEGEIPESQTIQKLREENLALAAKNAELMEANETLKTNDQAPVDVEDPVVIADTKPAKPQIPRPEDLIKFFKTPVGFKNLTSEKVANVQRVSFRVKKDQVIFRFNLANEQKVSKLRGYIFVAQFSKNSLKFYPGYDLAKNNFSIAFNAGESFTVSRFRPTIATFDLPSNGKEIYYRVLVFSKKGDLLIEDNYGPYNM